MHPIFILSTNLEHLIFISFINSAWFKPKVSLSSSENNMHAIKYYIFNQIM